MWDKLVKEVVDLGKILKVREICEVEEVALRRLQRPSDLEGEKISRNIPQGIG